MRPHEFTEGHREGDLCWIRHRWQGLWVTNLETYDHFMGKTSYPYKLAPWDVPTKPHAVTVKALRTPLKKVRVVWISGEAPSPRACVAQP